MSNPVSLYERNLEEYDRTCRKIGFGCVTSLIVAAALTLVCHYSLYQTLIPGLRMNHTAQWLVSGLIGGCVFLTGTLFSVASQAKAYGIYHQNTNEKKLAKALIYLEKTYDEDQEEDFQAIVEKLDPLSILFMANLFADAAGQTLKPEPSNIDFIRHLNTQLQTEPSLARAIHQRLKDVINK